MIHKNFQCEIYYLRHGESESNATPGYIAGLNHDSPLTERGVRQAEAFGSRFGSEGVTFDRVYSSSMIRTVQTAEAMLGAMGDGDRPFPRVDDLIEQQMPGWRGVQADDVMTDEMVAYIHKKGCTSCRLKGSRSVWWSVESPAGWKTSYCITTSSAALLSP